MYIHAYISLKTCAYMHTYHWKHVHTYILHIIENMYIHVHVLLKHVLYSESNPILQPTKTSLCQFGT